MLFKKLFTLEILLLPITAATGSDFNIHIGTIQLPDEFKLNKSTVSKRGNHMYVFNSSKSKTPLKTTLTITLFDFIKNHPVIRKQTPKTVATSCIKDTIKALNKSFLIRQTEKEKESLIGNNYALESSISGNMQGYTYQGNISCMKYKNYLVTTTLYESSNIKLIKKLKNSIYNIKMYK